MLNTYMAYTLQNMMSGDWIEGKRLSVNNFNNNFIEQFVDCVIELHSQDFEKTDIKLMQSVVDNLEHVDTFVTDSISEYNTIKEKFI